MSKQFSLYGIVLLVILCLTGVTAHADRTIDKIKYPALNDFEIPKVEKIELDNGMVLYLLEDHELPIVRARVRLAAGGYLEPADKVGLASITGEVMRTGGTARMTGDEIDEAMESIGASVEVGIDRTSGGASMNILSEYVDTGLEILADVLRTPQFSEDKIDLSKTAERSNISSRNDDPLSTLIREYRKVLYGGDSPYARHTEYATINAISRDDLIAFHNQYVTPENVMLAIWGDFNKDEMIAKIKGYFGDWQKGSGKVPKLPEVNYTFEPGVHYIEKEKVTQSTIIMGHIGGLTGDPDYFALTVANNVLSGSLGGRMFNEVRSKKGLAYSTGGNFTSNISYPGFFYGYVITKLESTVEASKAVKHEIERMQTDPPTPDELSKAKDSYLNSFVFNFDSKGEIINRMMTYDYFDFPQDFLYTAKKKIEQVTADDVIDVAKRRFHPDQMHLVVLGLADQFDEPLSVFGEVNEIDITIPTGEPEEEVAVSDETLAKGMDLLKRAVAACGGCDNFKKIKTSSSKASYKLIMPQGEMELGVTSLQELPDKSRETVNTPMGEMITVSNGDQGWMKQGPNVVEMPAEQMSENDKEQFRNRTLLFQTIDNPQFRAIYIETTKLNDIDVDIIKVESLDGKNSFKFALNAETGMPVGMMYFGETAMGPGNLTITMSDYREVSGIMVPFSRDIESDGNKVMAITIGEYKINPEIPAGSFDKP